MSLSALPSVLVQSCMHGLVPSEIISLAHCSHWTHQCADSAFAWRECPPARASASGLRRWCPLALTFGGRVDVDDARVDRCIEDAGDRRVSQLDIQAASFQAGCAVRLLTHPLIFHSLRVLTSQPVAELLAVAASLPSLRCIDLVHAAVGVFAPLAAAPALRELAVRTDRISSAELMELTCLKQVRVLRLTYPRLDGSNFRAFCSAMGHMERLELQGWDANSVCTISASDLADGFAALSSLHTLRCSECGVSLLLPYLHLAPALRRLHIYSPQLSVASDALSGLLLMTSELRVRVSALAATAERLETIRAHVSPYFAERFTLHIGPD